MDTLYIPLPPCALEFELLASPFGLGGSRVRFFIRLRGRAPKLHAKSCSPILVVYMYGCELVFRHEQVEPKHHVESSMSLSFVSFR